jgi:hypothetical protein
MLSKKAIYTFSHLSSSLIREGEGKYDGILVVL